MNNKKSVTIITVLSVFVVSIVTSLIVIKFTTESDFNIFALNNSSVIDSSNCTTAQSDEQTTCTSNYQFTSSLDSDLHQTDNLPSLTFAAEKAVKAIVNIENIRQVQVGSRRYGGHNNELFNFFFGPQQQQQQQPKPRTRERRSGGSGVIISTDGYIVTNNHVIDGAEQIKITLNNGQTYDARVIGADPSTDIALLKIDANDELPTLTFGNSDKLRLGQWVLAVGNPMGLNNTVTAGIISAKGRSLGQGGNAMLDIESFIQTDAVVNPGNSGGALVNTEGLLVGINTILKSNTGSYIGYSFAVPSSIVEKIVADIKEYGTVQRAVLGIRYSEISPEWFERFAEELNLNEKEGLYVGEVIDGGAAKNAGIKKNDVIISINEIPTKISSALQEELAKLRPGDKIDISIKRDGKLKHFNITLRNRVGSEELLSKNAINVPQILGAELIVPRKDLKKKLGIKNGLQIVSIKPNGLLAKSRVKEGFIILSINEKPIYSIADLNRMIDEIKYIDGVYPNGKEVMYSIIK